MAKNADGTKGASRIEPSAPSPGRSAARTERSAARLAATQALYQLEITGGSPEEVIVEFVDHRFGRDPETGNSGLHDEAFFADIVHGVLKRQVEIDGALSSALAAGWTLGRIDSILRALLRSAAFELISRRDVPAKVVISEYVELARDFFSGDEPAFVNAVLDTLAHGNRADEFSAPSHKSGVDL